MRTIRVYRFRYFDQALQRWIMARHVCEPIEIRCRYCDYQLIGAPEIRQVPDDSGGLSAAHLARTGSARARRHK